MKYLIAILTLSLVSCGVPVTVEYSAKGGLVVVVEVQK